jgi:hypothetical protein
MKHLKALTAALGVTVALTAATSVVAAAHGGGDTPRPATVAIADLTSAPSTTSAPHPRPHAAPVADVGPADRPSPNVADAPGAPDPSVGERQGDDVIEGERPPGADPSRGGVELPLGHLDQDSPVPEGLGFRAPPKTSEGGTTTGHGGPSSLSAGPGCEYQCITKGVAYPRGFGAELVVATSVPAQIYLAVVTEGEEYFAATTSPGMTSELTWALDDLEPGTTYHAMVGATDAHGHTSHAWGTFTTLSERRVHVEVGDVEVAGGPGGISSTSLWLQLDGSDAMDFTPGMQGIRFFDDVDGHIDLDLWVLRRWNADVCEAWGTPTSEHSPQGHSTDACLAWNSASEHDLDLDVAPAGETRWSSVTIPVSLQTPTGAGGALPNGYGDPYHFHFAAPVTVHVQYL